MKTKKSLVITAVSTFLLMLSGCAGSIMNGFVGQPLQQVMVKYGPPANAFDMGDGRRAFQWAISSTYVMPTTASTTGNAYSYGNSVAWTQNTQISGGVPITSSCMYTMYGRWNENTNTWIMAGYEKPNLMCQ